MTSAAEIYCYSNPGFKGELKPILDSLRGEGAKIVLGDDLEELLLLLQLAEPTAIIFTLSKEEDIVGPSFQKLSRTALDNSLPIMLMGPETSLDRFTLYKPKKTRFDEVDLSMSRLLDIVDALIHGLDALILPDIPEELRTSRPPRPSKVDVLGEGDSVIKVKTLLEGDDGSKIVTTVTRDDEVLVVEEQSLESDDPHLENKMQAQHEEATKAYTPADSGSGDPPYRYRSEISEPLESKPRDGRSSTSPLTRKKLRGVQVLLGVLAVLFLGMVLLLASRSETPETKEDSKTAQKRPVEQTGKETGLRGPVPDGTPVDTSNPSRPTALPPYEDLDEVSSLPFPASFRDETVVFWFFDEWEEERFVKLIQRVSEKKIIHVIGHPTMEEVELDKKSLGMSRAWAVQRFLVRKGIPLERLRASPGKPVPASKDLDDKNRPRRRYVEIQFEAPPLDAQTPGD